MKISIVTICYNNENDIRPTIESVVNQTYQNIEYIVIDGASNDNTVSIISEYQRKISRFISEPDNGIYDAINKGIKVATGDVVGLIHAGDELFDNSVIEKISGYFKSKNIDALYGHSMIYSQDGNRIVRINKSPKFNLKLFRMGWFPSHQSFYAKKELFDKFGYYNLKYKIAADYELILRFLYIQKVKVHLLDNYIVKFKLGGTSSSSMKNIIKHNRECVAAWKDNKLTIPFYTLPFKLVRKIKQFIRALLIST